MTTDYLDTGVLSAPTVPDLRIVEPRTEPQRMPPTPVKLRLDAAREAAGLTQRELWTRYITLGGARSMSEIAEFLNGEAECPADDYGLIARAIIERPYTLTGGRVELGPEDTVAPEDRFALQRNRSVDHQPPPVTRPTVSVVIPAMNEAKNLPYVLYRLPAFVDEVIIVDGHSTDATIAVALRCRPDAKIVVQDGKGKGNALACGFRAVTKDITVMLDADGSTDPAEIRHFVATLSEGSDFAKGTRFAPGAGSADITRLRRFGNRLLTTFVNLVWRVRYTDLCYGYNAFWTKHLPALNADHCNGFEVETLINIRAASSRLIVTEVPSFEATRRHGASNLKIGRDGIRVLRTILAEWMRPS